MKKYMFVLDAYLLNNSCRFLKAFWGGRLRHNVRTAQGKNNRLTLSLRGVLGDTLGPGSALPPGPLGTFLLGGVSLGHILALLILDILALNNVILNVVLMEPGRANTLGHFLAVLSLVTNFKRCGAFFHFLFRGNLLVLNEAVLPKCFITLLCLLWLKVSGVGGVALLAIGVLALNDVIVFGLLNHDNLVNAPLSGSSNGSDVKCYFVSLSLS